MEPLLDECDRYLDLDEGEEIGTGLPVWVDVNPPTSIPTMTPLDGWVGPQKEEDATVPMSDLLDLLGTDQAGVWVDPRNLEGGAGDAEGSMVTSASPVETDTVDQEDVDEEDDLVKEEDQEILLDDREISPTPSTPETSRPTEPSPFKSVRERPYPTPSLASIDRPPPEEYKKLSSREKRQIRNKISARNFRVRRKEYITQMEEMVADRDEKIKRLEGQVETHRVKEAELEELVASLKAIELKHERGERGEQSDPTAHIRPPLSSRPSQLLRPNTRKDTDPRSLVRSSSSAHRQFGGNGPVGVHTVFLPNYDHLTAELQRSTRPRHFFDLGKSPAALIKAEVKPEEKQDTFIGDVIFALQIAPMVLSTLMNLFAKNAVETALATVSEPGSCMLPVQAPWDVMASQVQSICE